MVILEELEGNLETSSIYRKRAELARKLVALTEKNGYQIIQTNGQRVYSPPPSKKIPPPPKGCEVFIGKLHRSIYEDELIPLFESIGALYKFRLMLDFTEKTRGYAFATYFTRENADKAIITLNNHQIRPRLHIGVYKSVDNCRLFIGNLPTDKTRGDVNNLLSIYADGITDIIMYKDYLNPHLNRGFAFIEFEDHRLAAMARRQFTPENLVAWGQPLYVDWADPLPDVDSRVMSKVTILYLRNLPLEYTTEELHATLCCIIGSRMIKKAHKMHNFAFVHFINRRCAEVALSKINGLRINNHLIEAEWARPRRFSKKFRLNKPPENFCVSVPPNMRRLVHQRSAEISTSSSSSSSNPNKTVPQFSMDSFYSTFVMEVPNASSPRINSTMESDCRESCCFNTMRF